MNNFKKTSLALIFALVTGFSAVSAFANPAVPFEQWLGEVRQEAIAQNINPMLVNKALTGFQPDPEIIRLDTKQPEFTQTYAAYSSKRVNKTRIERGQKMLVKHYDELKKASDKYGVAPQYIAALWGMETNYGGYTGGKDTVKSLATLAWHGRGGTSPKRAAYFRKELITALKIVDQGHITLDQMKGSWAGALGQVQFMPSSFMNLAQDGDGDGRKDIWNNLSDAFASAANYLAKNGWNDGQRWGREVVLPAGFDSNLVGSKKQLSTWKSMGIKLPNGAPIPVVPGMMGKVIAPDGMSGSAFLVYNNFHTIKRWNNSDKFALSVGRLADAIAAANPTLSGS